MPAGGAVGAGEPRSFPKVFGRAASAADGCEAQLTGWAPAALATAAACHPGISSGQPRSLAP